MVLDKDSRVYVTINMHLGLFRYTRLPFGIASERNYSQLKKGAWSLIFTVHTFHQYLHEREFTLYTDHKPLTTILGPKKGTPPIASTRLQQWALQLAAHNYTIQFRPTKAHANTEALSRLPLKGTESKEAKADLFSVRQIEALPVTLVQLKCATSRDPILSKVLRYTKYGWPDRVDETLKPYWNQRTELTLEDDCIMWGIPVVVPTKLQDKVLDELHRVHIGIYRAKALARSHIWWPGIDMKIEQMTSHVRDVRLLGIHPQQLLFIPGVGHQSPGKGYT